MISYSKFASRVSFFEFLQDEFYPPHFKIDLYKKELEILNQNISTDVLVRELEKAPKIFDVAEEFFQLKRFTNTQYVHFLFDVSKLNSGDVTSLARHAEVSIFSFENGNPNELFSKLYSPTDNNEIDGKVMNLKRTVVNYIAEILKNKKGREFLYHHISNSIGTRLRIATYLIENLHADKHFATTNLSNFLGLKRIPRDGKGIHGKYGTIKIKKILQNTSIPCVNSLLTSKELHILEKNVETNGWSYASEKMISGITKRKDGKLKKFDFILLKDGVPKYCIETNFYSTTGTKIGINIGEYTDLKDDIDSVNSRLDSNLKFTWITDGNHWLSTEGENGFTDLKSRYFTKDWEMLNYNLFSEMLLNMLN